MVAALKKMENPEVELYMQKRITLAKQLYTLNSQEHFDVFLDFLEMLKDLKRNQ